MAEADCAPVSRSTSRSQGRTCRELLIAAPAGRAQCADEPLIVVETSTFGLSAHSAYSDRCIDTFGIRRRVSR